MAAPSGRRRAEAYYKMQVTPRFAMTADLQVITKTFSSRDTNVVTDLRAS